METAARAKAPSGLWECSGELLARGSSLVRTELAVLAVRVTLGSSGKGDGGKKGEGLVGTHSPGQPQAHAVESLLSAEATGL